MTAFQQDCVQWIIDTWLKEPSINLPRMLQQTLGLLFAAAHQVPMVSSVILFGFQETHIATFVADHLCFIQFMHAPGVCSTIKG